MIADIMLQVIKVISVVVFHYFELLDRTDFTELTLYGMCIELLNEEHMCV